MKNTANYLALTAIVSMSASMISAQQQTDAGKTTVSPKTIEDEGDASSPEKSGVGPILGGGSGALGTGVLGTGGDEPTPVPLPAPIHLDRMDISILLRSGHGLSISTLATIDVDASFLAEGLFHGAGGQMFRELVRVCPEDASGCYLIPVAGGGYAGYDVGGTLVASVEVVIVDDPYNARRTYLGRSTRLSDGAINQFSISASGDYAVSGAADQALWEVWNVFDDELGGESELPGYCQRPAVCDALADGSFEGMNLNSGILGFAPVCLVNCPQPGGTENGQVGDQGVTEHPQK